MSSRSPAARCPDSDVSPWVGVVGVATLLTWIVLCRAWPMLAAGYGLPHADSRLSGPNAALAAMALTGSAMALWSVWVDKVHRRPSTGIDWQRPRPMSDTLRTAAVKLAGLWATWLAIGAAYALGRWYWDGAYLFAMRVIGTAAIPLLVLSIPYVVWLDRYLVQPRDGAWHFGALLLGRARWDAGQVKRHWRAWAIKGFFTAFMISILPGGFEAVVEADWRAAASDPVRAGVALFDMLFLVDVQIGTVGYLLTVRPLDSHIRSGNPLLSGWVAALICYPPVVYAFMGPGGIIQYEYNTGGWGYWFGGHDALLWAWAAMLAALTACYAWATLAFGIRFSNLTYRGVVTNGPYRFSRHPAYLSKNLFWWGSAMPFLVTTGSSIEGVRNAVFLALVSAIYWWRARTEEAHLLAEDAKYRTYHAWMAEHGAITASLGRLLRLATVRRPVLQPAE